MRMLDQITPVEIWTDATFPRAMLSSLLPNSRDFTRLTCCGVTMMRTGKKRLPLVQRLAVKVSELGRFGMRGVVDKQELRGTALRRADQTSVPRWLYPFQGALFPDPDVAYDQNKKKDQHLDQAEHAQRLELDRPGEEKNGFHVEDDEQDGDDVITNGVASSRAVYGINAAFVGHQFRLTGIVGAHQLGGEQGDRDQDSYKRYEDEYRNVVLWH